MKERKMIREKTNNSDGKIITQDWGRSLKTTLTRQ
jgi:hypothetical protein